MTVIEFPDEQAAALRAKATAAGLTLDAWLQRLAADREYPLARPIRHIADAIRGDMQDVPSGIMARMPEDGAGQHDHFNYELPKKEAWRHGPTRVTA
jgi:hypothetical protein